MIGFANELDPLPTTFDHPSRILRCEAECVNSYGVVLLTVWRVWIDFQASCSPVVGLHKSELMILPSS